IICDGRKGLLQQFPDIPCQLCQFHQVKTVTTDLTRNPKTEAARALYKLILSLKSSKKAVFQTALNAWYEQYRGFLNGRTFNEETGKSHCTHKRLRSAYLSLERNMAYLFTFEDYPDLHIPNTTNLLDGRFADLKQKLGGHKGMNEEGK
ncbi:IS256 family transposase, variant Zn-binding type, partial [Bergeriella denitrificans]